MYVYVCMYVCVCVCAIGPLFPGRNDHKFVEAFFNDAKRFGLERGEALLTLAYEKDIQRNKGKQANVHSGFDLQLAVLAKLESEIKEELQKDPYQVCVCGALFHVAAPARCDRRGGMVG